MKKTMLAAMAAALVCVAVVVLGCSRENMKNKEDEMEKVELNLTKECKLLVDNATESDVSIVVDTGEFTPTLYVHDGVKGTFYTLAGADSRENLCEMARGVIKTDPNIKAYLLDYILNGESRGGRKAVLIMETAAKGDAKVTALAFECNLDTKAVECSYLPNGPDTLFN